MTPWTAAHQASLSFIISQSLLKLMSIVSVMPSNHLILSCPFLLLPSVFPSIKVFSNESALLIRWPKYWSFNFSISPSNEYSGLISVGMTRSPCSPRDSQVFFSKEYLVMQNVPQPSHAFLPTLECLWICLPEPNERWKWILWPAGKQYSVMQESDGSGTPEQGYHVLDHLSFLVNKSFGCSNPLYSWKQCLSLVSAVNQLTNLGNTGMRPRFVFRRCLRCREVFLGF